MMYLQLQISDEDQPRFSIYRTEIGKYAIGEALNDEQLFDLYRDRGDAKGTVKLLVSHSSAPVHEPPDDSGPPLLPSSSSLSLSPSGGLVVGSPPTVVNTIPPPVLPQQFSAPLNPRRTRSRRDSQSSASEKVAAGYDASVSDDLEHAEGSVQTRRSTIRPAPQQQRTLQTQYSAGSGPPGSSAGQQSPAPVSTYSQSPSTLVNEAPNGTLDPQRMQSLEAGTGRSDLHRGSTVPAARLPTPPSTSAGPASVTSPQNTRFPEADTPTAASDRDVQGGSSTDVFSETQVPTQSQLQTQAQDRRRRPYQDGSGSGSARQYVDERDKLRRKDSAGRRAEVGGSPARRAKAVGGSYDSPGANSESSQGKQRMQDGWTMVPGDVPTSSYKKERSTPPQDARSPPSSQIGYGGYRSHPHGFSLGLGRGEGRSGETKRERQRNAKVVPHGWAVTFRPPETPIKSATSSSSAAASGEQQQQQPQTSQQQQQQKPAQQAAAAAAAASTSSAANQANRLMTKSIPDLRHTFMTASAAAAAAAHPAALHPGRSSRAPQQLPLLTRPGAGGSGPNGYGGASSSTGDRSTDGLPASYHEPSHMEMMSRAYDVHRNAHSPTSHHGPRANIINGSSPYSPPVPGGLPYVGATSPSTLTSLNDLPRPHTAVDDAGTGLGMGTIVQRPSTGLRSSPHLQSPYGGAHARNAYGIEVVDYGLMNSTFSPLSDSTATPSSNLDTPCRPGTKQGRSPSRSPIDVIPTNNRDDMLADSLYLQNRLGNGNGTLQRGIIDEDKNDDDEDDAPTLGRNAHTWLPGFIDENMVEEGTTRPRPRDPAAASETSTGLQNAIDTMAMTLAMGSSTGSSTVVSSRRVNCQTNEADSDSDGGGGGTIWAIKPHAGSSNADDGSRTRLPRPPLPPLSIENSPSSQSGALPNSSSTNVYTNGNTNAGTNVVDTSRIPPPGFPAPPDYIPAPPPLPRIPRRAPSKPPTHDQRTSRFDNDYDYTWAPRPPPEDVYERLEEYFPEHDLDKPVIETPSGGTSPTTEQMLSPPPQQYTPQQQQQQRFRHKKSIRVVAAEHKRRIDRSSRLEASNNSATVVLRKRGTKLWGSRLEEVTTEQARSGLPTSTSSESSPGTVAKRKGRVIIQL